MRFIFLLVLVANVALLAFGQGFFGTPPSEQGRAPQILTQRHQQAIVPGTPGAAGMPPAKSGSDNNR